MWLFILLMIGMIACSVMAIRARRLLTSALWLAGTSALVALFIYLLGAPEIAVIELSVGAGLVTVLFVFAIHIAGDDAHMAHVLIPKPLAWLLIFAAILILGWLVLPVIQPVLSTTEETRFSFLMWRNRSVDVLLQIVLMFFGVLGVLGLLADRPSHQEKGKTS
jgi:uncharacterized MnhB-related membrane protein